MTGLDSGGQRSSSQQAVEVSKASTSTPSSSITKLNNERPWTIASAGMRPRDVSSDVIGDVIAAVLMTVHVCLFGLG